jgi:hypothetical protein
MIAPSTTKSPGKLNVSNGPGTAVGLRAIKLSPDLHGSIDATADELNETEDEHTSST